jgi:hypothetical protein
MRRDKEEECNNHKLLENFYLSLSLSLSHAHIHTLSLPLSSFHHLFAVILLDCRKGKLLNDIFLVLCGVETGLRSTVGE